jgi:hypothetical protein
MAVMGSGGTPTIVINAAPTKHTVLNILSLKDTSSVKLIGDAILYIFTTAGTHSITIKNAGTFEVTG